MFSYPHILWQKKNQKNLQTKPEPLIFHFMGNKLWYDAEAAGMDFPVYSVWDTESSCCHLIQENARKKIMETRRFLWKCTEFTMESAQD